MMKILIAYDGSSGSDEMLADLKRAGLARDVEAMVVSVGEAWILLSSGMLGLDSTFASEAVGSMKEAQTLAQRAAERIQSDFPAWKVNHTSAVGSPASVLLDRAQAWTPDLLILGSHGHTAAGRFFLGSVSQTIATHAHCSVRVARAGKKGGQAPLRLLVGTDGSEYAETVLRVVASRLWPSKTEARVVTAYQVIPELASATKEQLEQHENLAAQVAEWNVGAKVRANEIARSAAQKLEQAGLVTSYIVKEEAPKGLLLKEAENWGADSIFVGARGLGRFERLWLGSVSTAVVSRAHCSVEIVRGTIKK